ncbi:GxxExxY protein, partial [Candidatus Gottesmanbacteria bacterium]|nr:GxxExxY protein [Candidatus Gottesmanbacteria bacterium]
MALLYSDLSYKLRGIFFVVYNEIGPGFKEEIYHRALVKEFTLRKIPFVEKKRLIITYKNEKVGIYEPDFIIDEKILVEIKSVLIMPKIFETQLY